MFSALRKWMHLSPATVIASLALVFAMTGGAYAAKKYLITSTKQISPSVLKSLQGKTGPGGAAGAAGAVGSQGPAGPGGVAGAGGAKGDTGPEGKKGTQGEKGEKGVKGAEGSPWTAGGTLPAGASESGTWAFGETPGTTGAEKLSLTSARAPISMTIPLATPIDNAEECGQAGHPACVVHIFDVEEGRTIPAGCTGTIAEEVVSELKAEPGNLCVWVRADQGVKPAGLFALDPEGFTQGVGRSGSIIGAGGLGEKSFAEGTWSVTA